jgi:hypothetical protein
MKDIVTDRQETERLKAQDVLGGPVKTRTGTEPKGKLPLGFRQARNLARKAMKGGVSAIHRSMEKTMQKENVTESTTEVSEVNEMSYGKTLAKAIMAKQSKRPIAQMMGEAGDEPRHTADAGEYDYEGDMAKSQLKSIITNAQRLHDMLEDTTNLPEWVQSKITLAEDYVLTAANYMEGEMNEEVEQIDEITRSLAIRAQHKAERKKWVASAMDDATPKGDNRFNNQAGDLGGQVGRLGSNILKRDRRVAARAAGKNRKGPGWSPEKPKTLGDRVRGLVGPKPPRGLPTMEEVEQVDEKINLVKAKMGDVIKDFKKSDAPQFKGKSMEKRREMAIAAKLGAEREAGMREEAEGTVAVTPKEKELAKHHGDPKKITYGDVIKARLKSAAAKKMGK